jgi:hypothetical protein
MTTKTETSVGESFAVAGLTTVLMVFVFAGFMVLMAPAFIIHGWVIATIWGWFVVPTFGLAPITIPVAIGLEMLVLLLRPNHPITNQNDGNTSGKRMMHYASAAYLGPFVILFIAYVAHLYA